ncbi:hypothetical protein HRbin39_00024 [bacterium HR39]|nr:hypothetical protein HRbin39_00024 [bacterium HR39]
MKAERLISFALFAAYLSTLAVSTAHLASWYRLTLGDLPAPLSWALAASLEMVAFLLSLAANLLPGKSYWAAYGAYVALGLVWLGNYRAMALAGDLPVWETFAQSLFVPVGTLIVAKALGDLAKEGRNQGRTPSSPRGENAAPGPQSVLSALPGSIAEIARRTGLPAPLVARDLQLLQKEGSAYFDGEVWHRR